MKTITEIRKNPIFKKVTLFRPMETDFRAFFQLVETIIKVRRNPIFKKYSC